MMIAWFPVPPIVKNVTVHCAVAGIRAVCR